MRHFYNDGRILRLINCLVRCRSGRCRCKRYLRCVTSSDQTPRRRPRYRHRRLILVVQLLRNVSCRKVSQRARSVQLRVSPSSLPCLLSRGFRSTRSTPSYASILTGKFRSTFSTDSSFYRTAIPYGIRFCTHGACETSGRRCGSWSASRAEVETPLTCGVRVALLRRWSNICRVTLGPEKTTHRLCRGYELQKSSSPFSCIDVMRLIGLPV